ncbi:MAG: plastocyanin/azurin family copper-binding protein [Pseudomonadota bacterium]|nr:plastocyanin/azurin family copper-binding protein [Pseudomonadota bacterium]
MQINKTLIAGLAVSGLVLSANVLAGDTVEIKALQTKFEPAVVFVKPGDTVRFSAMVGHDSVTLDGMIPEGAKGWKSAMGEDLAVTLDKEGVYVYKCSPHTALGMNGAVVVGEPTNLEQIHSHPENKSMIGRTIRQLDEEIKARGGE